MVETKNEVKEIEFEANWEGSSNNTNFKKIVIPQDSYNAGLKTIEVIQEPSFKNKEIVETKIKTILELDVNGVKTEFIHKINPKISKGSTGKDGQVYSNSKLFDLLIDLGLKDKFKEEVGSKFTATKICEFLHKNLAGKMLRVSVETKKSNTPEAYSYISKILRFVWCWWMRH